MVLGPSPLFSEPRIPTWLWAAWGLHSPDLLLSTCKAAGRRLHPGGALLSRSQDRRSVYAGT